MREESNPSQGKLVPYDKIEGVHLPFINKMARRGLRDLEEIGHSDATSGEHKRNDDLLLLDVIPLTISFEGEDRSSIPIIKRNTAIPCKATRVFTTPFDNQKSIELRLFLGESHLAVENRRFGEVVIKNIPPMARGGAQVEVTFQLDDRGYLSMTARNKATAEAYGMDPRGFSSPSVGFAQPGGESLFLL